MWYNRSCMYACTCQVWVIQGSKYAHDARLKETRNNYYTYDCILDMLVNTKHSSITQEVTSSNLDMIVVMFVTRTSGIHRARTDTPIPDPIPIEPSILHIFYDAWVTLWVRLSMPYPTRVPCVGRLQRPSVKDQCEVDNCHRHTKRGLGRSTDDGATCDGLRT